MQTDSRKQGMWVRMSVILEGDCSFLPLLAWWGEGALQAPGPKALHTRQYADRNHWQGAGSYANKGAYQIHQKYR
jgi:hypothetical protein